MGLNLMVGYLAEVQQEDPDLATGIGEQFEALQRCVARAGVAGYAEPKDLPEEARYSCQMWGYSGLHHLRRLAAHVAMKEPIYQPSSEAPDPDPVVDRYYEAVGNGDISDLPFQHLMLHGDSEGFYVPVDLGRVIDPEDQFDAVGGGIGSAVRLLAECKALAAVLELDESLDPEADEVWAAADSPGEGDTRWRRYGVESFSCLRLMRACERSIASGAAVVFC